jgi:hypothetical protein
MRRHLSPRSQAGNIMLVRLNETEEYVKLIDFGIAAVRTRW